MRRKLENLRIQKKLSKRQVAKDIGTNAQMLLYLENANRNGTIAMWKKIQDYYKVKDSEMWSIITEDIKDYQ